jgi:hypothetical protein
MEGAMKELYGGAARRKTVSGGYIGGLLGGDGSCGCVSGGYAGGMVASGGTSYAGGMENMQDYGNSFFSKAKENLIHTVAKNIFRNIGGTVPKDTKGILKAFDELIATVKGRGARPGSLEKVCKGVADGINETYGAQVINMGSTVENMCDQCVEVLKSLFVGLHTEYITIAGDVNRVISNMQLLKEAMDASYAKLLQYQGERSDSDNSLIPEAKKLYDDLSKEYNRQLGILTNLLNTTVKPAASDIISDLESNSEFSGMIRDLKGDMTSNEFGNKLSGLLAGVNSVLRSAQMVDQALKKLGMGVEEFKQAKNPGDVRMRVLKHLTKLKPTSKELDSMMKAANIIYNMSYDHRLIAQHLGKHISADSMKKAREMEFAEAAGGDDHDDGAGDNDHNDDDVAGGRVDVDNLDVEVEKDGLPVYYSKKSLSKKIQSKAKLRKSLLVDFKRLLQSQYKKIVSAVSTISDHVGREIPISDDLDYFIKSFKNLPTLNKENIHIAISGYPQDPASKQEREIFMNEYALFDQTIVPLTRGQYGQVFNNLRAAIAELMKTITDFSENMVRAVTEVHVDSPDDIVAKRDSNSQMFYATGGDEIGDIFEGGDPFDDREGSEWHDLKTIQNKLFYNYKIAIIRDNMKRISSETRSYGADYENLLGEISGWIINNINKEYDQLCDSVEKDPINGDHKTRYDQIRTLDEQTKKKTIAKLKLIWKMQRDAKINMVKIAESVDMYMKSFTDGIIKNFSTIDNIAKVLSDVNTISKWNIEKAGDNLAALCDEFPATPEDQTNEYELFDANGKLKKRKPFKHYYDQVMEFSRVDK